MKIRNEILIFAVFLGLAALVSMTYVIGKERAIGRLRMEAEDISRRLPAVQAEAVPEERLSRMFPVRPDYSPFVDSLYQNAQRAGVRNLEVQTLGAGVRGGTARSRRPQQVGKAEKTALMRVDVIKITMEGTYRNIAEYIRLMQNNERFVRIADLELRIEKDLLKAGLTVEIFSIPGSDAA